MTRALKLAALGLAGLAFAGLLAYAPDGASVAAVSLLWSPLFIIAAMVSLQEGQEP